MPSTLTQPEFEQRLKEYTNGQIVCLNKYKGRHHHYLWKHLVCNQTFRATPNRVYQNVRVCPHCRSQKRSETFYEQRDHKDVKVRCDHKHRFRIKHSQINAFKKGKIKCPICKKLKVLDPLYENEHVDFSFENRLLINLGLERAAYFKEIL